MADYLRLMGESMTRIGEREQAKHEAARDAAAERLARNLAAIAEVSFPHDAAYDSDDFRHTLNRMDVFARGIAD